MPRISPPSGFGVAHARSQPFRIGLRALLIGAFALAVLIALSGAFLIGLAGIGVLAAGMAGFELARRGQSRRVG